MRWSKRTEAIGAGKIDWPDQWEKGKSTICIWMIDALGKAMT